MGIRRKPLCSTLHTLGGKGGGGGQPVNDGCAEQREGPARLMTTRREEVSPNNAVPAAGGEHTLGRAQAQAYLLLVARAAERRPIPSHADVMESETKVWPLSVSKGRVQAGGRGRRVHGPKQPQRPPQRSRRSLRRQDASACRSTTRHRRQPKEAEPNFAQQGCLVHTEC